jgi:protein-tyrosine-phosphatase
VINLENKTIFFVCEHGAAKSIVASAWFNKLAAKNGLDFHSVARGTHPDDELGPKAVSGLANDGLTPAESAPQKLSLADVEAARHMVTFCDLPQEYQDKISTEAWAEVPDISDGYEVARDAIVAHIEKLISRLNRQSSLRIYP